MDEVKIIKYSAENHSAVRRLFSSGMLEHRKAAVFFGLKSRKLQALLLSGVPKKRKREEKKKKRRQ